MTLPTATKRMILLMALAALVVMWGGCSDDPTTPGSAKLDQPQSVPETLTEPLRLNGKGLVQPVPINKPYNPIDFRDGLVAVSHADRQGILTTLTDKGSGAVVAQMTWHYPSRAVTIDIPGYTSESFDGPAKNPNFFGMNVTLYYVYQSVLAGAPGKVVGDKDEPGCDRIPDWLETTCMRACCAIHDACYAAESPPCTEKSWFGTEGLACSLCNAEVVACMITCLPWYVPDWIVTRAWELVTQ